MNVKLFYVSVWANNKSTAAMNEAMPTWMCEIHFAKSGRSTGFWNLAVCF